MPGTHSDERLDRLEARLRNIEWIVNFFFKPIGAISVVSIVAILIYLIPKYMSAQQFLQEVQTSEQKLKGGNGEKGLLQEEQELRDHLQNLDRQLSLLSQKQAQSLLLARIKSFEKEPAPEHYSFQSDLEHLDDFALEYVALLGEAPGGQSEEVYSELRSAADAVVARARVELPRNGEAGEGLRWHLESPRNFQNILEKLQRGDGEGSPGEKMMCYESAFPVWLGQVGLYEKEDKGKKWGNQTSEKCRQVLGFDH